MFELKEDPERIDNIHNGEEVGCEISTGWSIGFVNGSSLFKISVVSTVSVKLDVETDDVSVFLFSATSVVSVFLLVLEFTVIGLLLFVSEFVVVNFELEVFDKIDFDEAL